MSMKVFIFADAHITGLGAILAQGKDIQSARPVAVASRTTTNAEKRYPQLDLEAMSVDFGLRRFRNYVLGAPETVTVTTDHRPLCSIFSGSRTGSIRIRYVMWMIYFENVSQLSSIKRIQTVFFFFIDPPCPTVIKKYWFYQTVINP